MNKLFLSLFISLLIIFPAMSHAQSANGLKAYYSLDGNGSDSLNKTNGTVYGAIATTNRFGEIGKAMFFDGVDDYIDLGTATELDIKKNITVSAWIKTPSTWTSTFHPGIYGRGTPNRVGVSGRGMDLYVYLGSDSTQRNGAFIYLPNNSNSWGSNLARSFTLDSDTWYHIVGVRDSNKTLVYINGTMADLDTIGPNGDIDYGNSIITSIGRNDDYQYFKGVIDELRIYDRALDSSDIKSIYNEPKPTHTELVNTESISLYPNPSTGDIKVNGLKSGSIKVYNNLGQLLLVSKIEDSKVLHLNLPSGSYNAIITSNQDITSRTRFVILD